MMAYDLGCKGVTYFREGCNRDGVLRVERDNDANDSTASVGVPATNIKVKPALQEAMGKRYKLKTGCGSLWVHLYNDEDGLRETFITTGANGGCRSFTVATSRLISLALRAGVPVHEVIDQLESVSPCVSYCTARAKGKEVSAGASCPSAIAKLLKDSEILEHHKLDCAATVEQSSTCQHTRMLKSEGCLVCPDCGYSKCD